MFTGLENRQCRNDGHEDTGEEVGDLENREPVESVGLAGWLGCCPHREQAHDDQQTVPDQILNLLVYTEDRHLTRMPRAAEDHTAASFIVVVALKAIAVKDRLDVAGKIENVRDALDRLDRLSGTARGERRAEPGGLWGAGALFVAADASGRFARHQGEETLHTFDGEVFSSIATKKSERLVGASK